MGKEESMSLEETNKVRISLGMAPLAADDGDDEGGAANDGDEQQEDDQDALAEANWEQKRSEERRVREEKETKDRLAKARNQRDLRAKLQGKGLGEAEVEAAVVAASGGSSGSASDWIKKSRKAAKLRAAELEKLKQREKELEERDRDALYGETDLEGLRVTHGVDDFEEGRDVVLTLKDNKVLADDGECHPLLIRLQSIRDIRADSPNYCCRSSCSTLKQTTSYRTSISLNMSVQLSGWTLRNEGKTHTSTPV